MSKSALIKFRCEPAKLAEVDRIAARQRRERADLLRIWLDDWLKREEVRGKRKK